VDALKRVIHVAHQTAFDVKAVVVQLDLDGRLQRRYDELYQAALWAPEWSVVVGAWLGEMSIKVEEAVERLGHAR
jgi:hypothetical protein